MSTEIVVDFIHPLDSNMGTVETSTQVVVVEGLQLVSFLTGLQDVESYAGNANKYLKVNTAANSTTWEIVTASEVVVTPYADIEAVTVQAALEEQKADQDAIEERLTAEEIKPVFPMTADFEARRELRKREYAGSGMAEWGKHASATAFEKVNQGIWTLESATYNNALRIGRGQNSVSGDSRTHEPIAIVDGIEHHIENVATGNEDIFNLVQFPDAPDGTKTLSDTGAVHKYTDKAGVGEFYDALTVDYDGSTYAEIPTYNMAVGSKVSLKVKHTALDNQYIIDAEAPRAFIYLTSGVYNFVGFSELKINGTTVLSGSFTPVTGVEYHMEAISSVATSIEHIGVRYSLNNERVQGEIYDIQLQDDTLPIPSRWYKSLEHGVTGETLDTSVLRDYNHTALRDGYMPDYDGTGYITIPEFPLADNMNISMIVRLDDVSSVYAFGHQETGSNDFYFASHPSTGANTLQFVIGNTIFDFNTAITGRIYFFGINITKNVGANYTVTGTCNQQTVTEVNVDLSALNGSISNFALGGYGHGASPAIRWDGAIFGFGIEYPDAPDLNRVYGSVSLTDPTGTPDELVLHDGVGYGSEDWTPSFTPSADVITVPPFTVSGDFDYEFTFVTDIVSANQLSGQLNSSALGRLYAGIRPDGSAWFGYGSVNEIIAGYNIPAGETNVFKIEARGVTASCYINGVLVTTLTSAVPVTELNNFAVGAVGDIFANPDNHMNGSITNVRLTDLTNHANSRHYPLVINQPTQPTTLVATDTLYDKDTAPFYTPAYGINNTCGVTIPTWTPSTDNSFSVKARIDSFTSTSSYIIEGRLTGSDPVQTSLSYSNTGIVSVRGITELTVTPLHNPLQTGVEYTFTGKIPVNGFVSRFGYTWNSSAVHNGKIWDISLTDNTDPTNSRFYGSIEYSPAGAFSGTVLEASEDSAVLSDTFATDWTRSAQGSISGNTLTVTNATSGIQAGLSTRALDINVLITIEFYVDSFSGTNAELIVYRQGSGDGSIQFGTANVGTTFSITFNGMNDFGTDNRFYFSANDNQTFEISNIRIWQEVDGTLVNFPSGNEWQLLQSEEAQSNGELIGFTGGSEWAADLPVTDGSFIGFTQPWHYVTSSTDGTIVGTTAHKISSLQPSQKAFYEYADYMGNGHNVITSRKDLVFLETWREKITTFVCPFGNVQFGGTSHDGVPLVPVTNFVGQGYSAFGEWDILTVGRVADWVGMSDTQKLTWSKNEKNNIHYDESTDSFYMENYRVRTIEGLGDDWLKVRDNGTSDGARLAFDGSHKVLPQGKLDTSIEYDNTNCFAASDYGTWKTEDKGSMHVYPKSYNDSIGESTGYALPIALVQRLNQGAYHPVYNQGGCRKWRDGSPTLSNSEFWYQDKFAGAGEYSTPNAFKILPTGIPTETAASSTSGYIGASAGDGRSDQYDFYDAIYAGQVEDLRLNANKLDYNRLLEDATRSAVGGTTRGLGKVPFTRNTGKSVTTLSSGTSGFIPIGKASLTGNFDWITATNNLTPDEAHGYMIINGSAYAITGVTVSGSGGINVGFNTTYVGNPPIFNNVDVVFGDYLSASYDSLPWVDIIGDPVRIAATFPDGVVGMWQPQIPDGSTKDWFMNRKVSDSSPNSNRLVDTDDNGVTWSEKPWSSSFSFNSTANGYTNATPTGRVRLLHYSNLSNFTESDTNRKVEGQLGDVVGTQINLIGYGNRLAPSLINKVLTSSQTPPLSVNKRATLTHTGELTTSGILIGNRTLPTHNPLDLNAPDNNSPAVKALPHLVEKDGLLYVQYHGSELAWATTAATPTEVATSAAFSYEIGKSYYLNHADFGVVNQTYWQFKVDTTNNASQILATLDHVVNNPSLKGETTIARLWNGSGWGDNQTIPIVDNESVRDDLNGNSVKTFTHTEQIPVGIANQNNTL
ncbi:hypothetical protein PE36_00290 [Moritella sp. PE36]|uniref:hypothetical protein n=1 Tax=Moritella sp. PE36 TaxID=58051 RepID=UPI00015693D6|nr:hypothetical protein [Moritella sp. PE36]EDM66189.1 hypothetical protein PE36_00290 [Moritella sp. PE36]